MSDIIKLLPDSVANQIAAGEVVQRPASVVKELIENSIDAGADSIKLNVKDAGRTLIQIIDNGFGMSPADAEISFKRHATSKISSAEDLFKISSKGFRGEALASIAAIARVEMKTRRAEDELATVIVMEGSELKSTELDNGPQGTVISVKNLFYNTPARRNFLKSDNVEIKHIIDEFLRVALAHTDIEFNLTHNGNIVYSLQKSNLKKRLDLIFGSKNKDRFFPISEETDLVKLNGFISKPEYSKKRRGEQFFFVNQRYIKSSYLNHAVSKAFESLIPDENFPSYFIFLEVDPNTIDINIHPTKTEIKFEDEKSLYAILFSSIKHSLGQYNISPSLDFEIDRELDDEIAKGSDRIVVPAIEVDPDFNPFKESKRTGFSGGFSSRPSNNSSWDALYSGLEDVGEIRENLSAEYTQTEQQEEEFVESFESKANLLTTKVESKHYQIHGKYIASQVKSGIILVDQRRAHRRILFDEFMRNFEQKKALSQQLLFPVAYSLDMASWTILQELLFDLREIGFDFGEYKDGELSIIGIPYDFNESDIYKMLDSILDDIASGEVDVKSQKADLFAKSYANTKAVKYGQKLNSQEMENIFNLLFACENHSTCPSGKLISKIISLESIEESFG